MISLTCPICGTNNPAGSYNCSYCGAALPVTVQPTSTSYYSGYSGSYGQQQYSSSAAPSSYGGYLQGYGTQGTVQQYGGSAYSPGYTSSQQTAAMQSYDQQYSQSGVPATTTSSPTTVNNYYTSSSQLPLCQHKTNYGMLKTILLGLITVGIYPLVMLERLVTEINVTAGKRDGQFTRGLFSLFVFSILTCGIYDFIWLHNLSKRVGDEARRRGSMTSFGASSFWLWGVLGSLLCFVGPLIYIHQLCKTMNFVNQHYNING